MGGFSGYDYRDWGFFSADNSGAGCVCGRVRGAGVELMLLKRRLFSALSWRVEARASSLPVVDGDRVRHRYGHLMGWAGAHRSLPEVENRAAILCFHSVTGHRPDPEVESDSLYVGDFRKLLRVLRTAFRVVPLGELVAAIRDKYPPSPKSVAITFDDGYANNHTVAAAELAKMKMPWSAFLPAGLIETGNWQWIDDVRVLVHRGSRRRLSFRWDGEDLELDLTTSEQRGEAVTRIHRLCRYVPERERRARLDELYAAYSTDEVEGLRARYPSYNPMSWHQARELKSAGVDVGSHSLNHIALGQQPADVIRHEVFGARELLQRQLGDHSPHFSYPYGRPAALSDEADGVVTEAGYACGLTLEQEVIDCACADLIRLPRLIVSAQVGRVLFGLWQRFNA